jgi:hypothetical protein
VRGRALSSLSRFRANSWSWMATKKKHKNVTELYVHLHASGWRATVPRSKTEGTAGLDWPQQAKRLRHMKRKVQIPIR